MFPRDGTVAVKCINSDPFTLRDVVLSSHPGSCYRRPERGTVHMHGFLGRRPCVTLSDAAWTGGFVE